MGDDTKQLSTGDRWQPVAATLNGYQAAADYVRDLQSGGGALPNAASGRQVVVASVKNGSGRDCSRFDVLGIDAPIFSPSDDADVFASRIGLSCVVPSVASHVTRFVVLLEPAEQDALVRACVVGVVPIRLKVVFEWHEFAHIANDESTRLVSDCVGFPILWKDTEENADEDGNRWALVKIGGNPDAMGVWRNTNASIGPHEHFRIVGTEADANGHPVLLGMQPSDVLGPHYAVNGSQAVGSGEYGVYQRCHQVFAAYNSTTAPVLGDCLGLAPACGAVALHYPDVCRCLGIVDAEHSILLAAPFEQPQRFKLLEPLSECGTAFAQIMGRTNDTYAILADYAPATMSDSLRMVAQSLLTTRNTQTGQLCIPAGTCVTARYAHGKTDFWEVLGTSDCTCQSSSSSSQSDSSAPSSSSDQSSDSSGLSSNSSAASLSGSTSQSDNSQHSSGDSGSGGSTGSGGGSNDASNTSSSQGSTSQASTSQASTSQGSGSQTDTSQTTDSGGGGGGSQTSNASGGSGGSADGSGGGSMGSGGGSGKSSAIVPASWTAAGYTALFVAECPEVRFDDILVAHVANADAYLPIDKHFLEVCESNSVQVCGCVPDLPVLIGAVVEGSQVHVRIAKADPNQPVRVVIRLTGIRRGFGGLRFPNRTKTQFEANERFIKSAYSQ